MSGVGYVAALLLAGVFALAAIGKARDRDATTLAFRAQALPAPGLLAVVVPALECGLAGTLAAAPRAGGAVALALLAVFSAVITRSLRAGVRAGCGCFGTAHRAPVSHLDLGRNALLALLAGAALWPPRPAVPGPDAVVLVSTAAATGLVLLGLADLHHRLGRLWDNSLAGEAATRTGRR